MTETIPTTPADPHRDPANGTRRNDTVLAAAIAVELETGERETSPAAAKAHILVRVLRSITGVVITIVGVALTVLPGPGILLILAGLGVLAIDYPFAARLRDRLLQTGGRFAGRAAHVLRRVLLGLTALVITLGALLTIAVIALVKALG